jgi:hypothetical protein
MAKSQAAVENKGNGGVGNSVAAKAKREKAAIKAFAFIIGEKAILSAAGKFARQAKTLQETLHIVASSALNHAKLHGDLTVLSKVMEAVPYGFHRRGLDRWVTAYAPFSWNGAKGYAIKEGTKGKWMDAVDIDGAASTPFYTMKQNVAENAPFDFDKALGRLLETAHKRLKTGKLKDPDTTAMKVRSIETILGLNAPVVTNGDEAPEPKAVAKAA